MGVAPTQLTPFQKWQAGIPNPPTLAWNSHDATISAAVTAFNSHLAATPGFVVLPTRTIKAMVWVETGAANAQWTTKPLQIGVTGDPGLAALLGNVEGGELILPSAIKTTLTAALARTDPIHNIRAGIGYLLMRMATFEFKSVLAPGSAPFSVTVKAGDSLDKIARTNGSTPEVMKQLNPGVVVLTVGQVLRCQKASIQRQITGWRTITTTAIAARYNGGGDSNYAAKLNYVLTII
jgi:LysM repeat protein